MEVKQYRKLPLGDELFIVAQHEGKTFKGTISLLNEQPQDL